MRKSTWTISLALVAALLAGQVAPATARSGGRDDAVVAAMKQLTRGSDWEHVDTIDLDFNVEHPQGMVKLGDRFFISSVEIVEPTMREGCPELCDGYDRTAGKGVGHLFVVDSAGSLLADVELGEGAMYHPGGIDFDGRWLWVPVAEYRPDSASVVYKVDPETLAVREAFRVRDHIGGVVRDRASGHLHGVSWGSRRLYEWTARGHQVERTLNQSHFVDYQDCDYVAFRKMICGGVAGLPAPDGSNFELGGLALIDLRNNGLVHEIPVQRYSPATDHVATRNPVSLEATEQGVRLYGAPDDDPDGAILVYDVTL